MTLESSKIKYDLFIIDGKTYDLRDWIGKHPGGSVWFSRSNGRDISAAIHSYHKNPEILKKIIKKYEVASSLNEARDPTLNVPPFIVPADFNAHLHTLTYDWEKKDTFFDKVKEKLETANINRKIELVDYIFDIVAASILFLHILMMFVGVYYNLFPTWFFVLFFLITRTSLAAVGHYHCHRKKNGIADWGDALFDMQYVGANLVLYDGHVMLHHLYTNSPADPKRTVFTGMLELPRIWRVPVYTIHRFGQFLTGMFVRWISFTKEPNLDKAEWNTLKHIQFFIVRSLLIAEFFFCCYTNHFSMWFIQFMVALWWNLFLIVSSHDFEESETKADLTPGQDWGIFQVKNSFDMSVIGNQYIDCFLTAGLGCHRVHHVLPAQRSGFANIISEFAVKEVALDFNLEWSPTKNFILHRLPMLFKFYMFAPARLTKNNRNLSVIEEILSLEGYKRVVNFVIYGFRGVGSI